MAPIIFKLGSKLGIWLALYPGPLTPKKEPRYHLHGRLVMPQSRFGGFGEEGSLYRESKWYLSIAQSVALSVSFCY